MYLKNFPLHPAEIINLLPYSVTSSQNLSLVCTGTGSVADLHYDAEPDANPDPACHFDEDADLDPEPVSHFDAIQSLGTGTGFGRNIQKLCTKTYCSEENVDLNKVLRILQFPDFTALNT
jgi:hypothetical protein